MFVKQMPCSLGPYAWWVLSIGDKAFLLSARFMSKLWTSTLKGSCRTRDVSVTPPTCNSP